MNLNAHDSVLQYDPSEMMEKFNHMPFLIHHRLETHLLLQLPRIIELARSLPEHLLEYNRSDLAVDQDYAKTPRTGLSAEETLEQIEQCRSWMVLKNVEIDAEYASLLKECLAEIAIYSEKICPGICRPEAFIFVSSPDSITPYHMDPEHNLLLQIRGSKRVTVFDGNDRSILSELQIERFYAGAHRNMQYKEEFAHKGRAFELGPGQGLHIPITAPHWVANGSSVSVSFSVTFRTRGSSHRESIYKINSILRSLGMSPAPPDRSSLHDAAKITAHRVLDKLHRLRSR